jgi:hypothetical protein
MIVGFAHGEHDFWNGQGGLLGGGFYARIGLYVSRDGGLTFQRYSSSPAIVGNVTFETVYQAGVNNAFDISGGAAILRPDGLVYVYYSDEYNPLPPGDRDQALAASCGVCLAVAAIPVGELQADIAAGRMPHLKKYYRGGFTESAIGGRFSPIISPTSLVDPKAKLQEYWVVWPSVGRITSSGAYVLAYMSEWGGIRMRTSPDGLTGWSDGIFIAPHRSDDIAGAPIPATPYPTIIANGADHHRIDGDDFYLYYQSAAWPGGYDWPHSRLVRRRVSLTPARYRTYAGYFSYSAGFVAYSNGQGHYCTIASPKAFAKLNPDATIPYVAAHLEPTLEGWINDGACLG